MKTLLLQASDVQLFQIPQEDGNSKYEVVVLTSNKSYVFDLLTDAMVTYNVLVD